MSKAKAASACELCKRGNDKVKNAARVLQGVRVVLCEDCDADDFKMREVHRRIAQGEIG